jgi:hypothetical protein
MEMYQPTWRFIKIDVWEETRVGILPQIPKPIWRGTNVKRLHRFDLGMHNLLKAGRFADVVGVGGWKVEGFTWRSNTRWKGTGVVVLL